MTGLRRIALGAISVVLIGGGQASDMLPYERLTIKGFKYKDAKLLLVGREALVSGRRVQIKGARAVVRQGADDVVIFTPELNFDKVSRRGSGTKRINVRRRQMLIDGVGFDVDFNTQRIVIRSNVMVKIFGRAANLLGN